MKGVTFPSPQVHLALLLDVFFKALRLHRWDRYVCCYNVLCIFIWVFLFFFEDVSGQIEMFAALRLYFAHVWFSGWRHSDLPAGIWNLVQFFVPPEGLSFSLILLVFLKQSSFHGFVSCKFSRVMLCSGRVRRVGSFLLVYFGRPISLSVLLGCFWLSCRWLKRLICCILTSVLQSGLFRSWTGLRILICSGEDSCSFSTL